MTVVSNLVHKLGGPAVVARWCGSFITGDAVTAWGARDQIPWRWRTQIKAMADARGIRLNANEKKAISLNFDPLVTDVSNLSTERA